MPIDAKCWVNAKAQSFLMHWAYFKTQEN